MQDTKGHGAPGGPKVGNAQTCVAYIPAHLRRNLIPVIFKRGPRPKWEDSNWFAVWLRLAREGKECN